MRVEVCDDVAVRACALVVDALREGGAVLLSGGSTPRPAYAALAQRDDVPWDDVDVWFADERCVPHDAPSSNFGMVRKLLLDRVPARGHAVDTTLPPDEAARRYAAELPAAFALALLGMGADGHTASLFPGDPALLADDALVLPSRSPKAPRARITLTLPALARAERVVFLVTGREKSETLARIARGADLPAGRVRARDGALPLWLVDEEAAAEL